MKNVRVRPKVSEYNEKCQITLIESINPGFVLWLSVNKPGLTTISQIYKDDENPNNH